MKTNEDILKKVLVNTMNVVLHRIDFSNTTRWSLNDDKHECKESRCDK